MPWGIVWMTDDGPSVDGPFDTRDEAMDYAFEEWCAYQGGVVGGYEYDTLPDERRAEFDKVYEYSDKIWLVPLATEKPPGRIES